MLLHQQTSSAEYTVLHIVHVTLKCFVLIHSETSVHFFSLSRNIPMLFLCSPEINLLDNI